MANPALAGEAAGIPYTADHHPVILPIDAEAIYLNPRIGLVDASRLIDDTAGMNDPRLVVPRFDPETGSAAPRVAEQEAQQNKSGSLPNRHDLMQQG